MALMRSQLMHQQITGVSAASEQDGKVTYLKYRADLTAPVVLQGLSMPCCMSWRVQFNRPQPDNDHEAKVPNEDFNDSMVTNSANHCQWQFNLKFTVHDSDVISCIVGVLSSTQQMQCTDLTSVPLPADGIMSAAEIEPQLSCLREQGLSLLAASDQYQPTRSGPYVVYLTSKLTGSCVLKNLSRSHAALMATCLFLAPTTT